MKIPIGESRLLSTDLSLTELLEIEGTLTLDPTKNITISTTKNISITGKLISNPGATVIHRILFTGISENNFIGGGDTVLDTDIGLWVVGSGQIDLQGRYWNLGDNYDPQSRTFAEDIEVAIQTAIQPNIRIEGTSTGQSHLFIKSTKPQTIKYVQFRFMGPRKNTGGDSAKELVTGRYAVHFHHCGDGVRGSIVEGCIARDCNNHTYVVHASHGVTMRGNIAYNVMETAFWCDLGHKTNDWLIENNLVVKVSYTPRAQDQDSDGAPTFGAEGFLLGFGDGNICRGNVVIGTSGDPRSAGAYGWPEIRNDMDVTLQLESSWTFENNTSINCPSGERVWQNNLLPHIIRNSIHINCQNPLFHGAYQNDYNRQGGYYKGGYVDIRAASATTNRIRFEGVTFDADGGDYCVIINEGPLNGAAPILFRNCKFINYRKAAILDQNPGPGLKSVDIIDCGLQPGNIIVTATKSGETVRLQEGDKAWRLTKSGNTPISKFAPSLWGTGTGLKAEYFSPDFKTKYLERVEPNVNLFDLTHPSPHYLVPTTFAARWTGKIQPQYSEKYSFYIKAGGGFRLWINGTLLVDKWQEQYPIETGGPGINLEAGKLYDFKAEFFNSDDRSGFTVEWGSKSLPREFIPMSQLYPGEAKPPDPPVNQKPVADAGQDQLIGIGFTLFGKGMDIDGVIASYKWEQVSGPASVITKPTEAITQVLPDGKGEYIFRLTVTDDKGASGVDEVKVVVG